MYLLVTAILGAVGWFLFRRWRRNLPVDPRLTAAYWQKSGMVLAVYLLSILAGAGVTRIMVGFNRSGWADLLMVGFFAAWVLYGAVWLLRLLPTIHDVDFPSDPVLGATTVNIGTITGGTEANIIPGNAESEVMLRLVSDVEPVKHMISDWAHSGGADVEFGSTIPAQRFHVLDGYDVAPVSYTSDIPLLARWGTPLLFGPGSIHVAHTPDEYVDVDELRASVSTYASLVRQLLAQ